VNTFYGYDRKKYSQVTKSSRSSVSKVTAAPGEPGDARHPAKHRRHRRPCDTLRQSQQLIDPHEGPAGGGTAGPGLVRGATVADRTTLVALRESNSRNGAGRQAAAAAGPPFAGMIQEKGFIIGARPGPAGIPAAAPAWAGFITGGQEICAGLLDRYPGAVESHPCER
jgi:hypothetical protein